MKIDLSKDYVLENDVVLLRPLSQNDIEYLLPFSLKEPELCTYSLLLGNGEENLKKYIDVALSSREIKTAYPFIVFDKRMMSMLVQPVFMIFKKGITQLG